MPSDQNPAVTSGLRRRAAFRYVSAHRGRALVVVGVRELRLWGFYDIDDLTRLEGRERGLQTAGVAAFIRC